MADARYKLEIRIEFLGHAPARYNRGTPEVRPAQYAAVAAARRLLEDAGYSIARTGHGVVRLDKP